MGVTEAQAINLLHDEDRTFVDRPGGPDLRVLAA